MQKEINTENCTFYTKRAIGIATFIGGPIAAGYLVSENYKQLQETQKGNNILIISIAVTIALFVLIFSIPENIIAKVPNVILPAIYTGIIVVWAEQAFGGIFKQHEENNYPFYSIWRAVAVGIVSLLILVLSIFGFIYFSTDVKAENLYIAKMEKFHTNEDELMIAYVKARMDSDFGLILALNKEVIPKWKENIEIVKQASTIENLPADLIAHNKKVLIYSELRLKLYELTKKALSEHTDKYNLQLTILDEEIARQTKAINE
ncbi:MAG: hypothetical protein AB8B65_13755 [Kordia sp.]|uniref:hypothetical protein n=1 Tax=Kordia sp. TaxID=1965332 RepID=UPI00385B0804